MRICWCRQEGHAGVEGVDLLVWRSVERSKTFKFERTDMLSTRARMCRWEGVDKLVYISLTCRCGYVGHVGGKGGYMFAYRR